MGMRTFFSNMGQPRKATGRGTAKSRRRPQSRYWSKRVTQTSDAMDLEEGVFKGRSARAIAQSLKRSAQKSHRRKANPFQSAMSMLNFYLNRAGKNLPASRKRVLGEAKDELRRLFARAMRPSKRSS
jgi:hypothetical protein